MRAAVPAIPVLAMAFAAHAASFEGLDNGRFNPATVARALPSPAAPLPHIRDFDIPTARPSIALSDHAAFAAPRRTDLPLLGPPPTPPPSGSGFAIGPIRADMIAKTSGRSGRVSFKPHYRLDGVTVLGGAIGGSIDGRGGMLTLQWHTAP